MRNRSDVIKNSSDARENYWKRRPSEIRGYNRTLYTTTEEDDYIRVDYNLKEKKVRLYIEDGEEGGNPYYSVISNGKISVERNATTGRVSILTERFSKRSEIFSSIPNKEVLRLINKNYGIGYEVPENSVGSIKGTKKKKAELRKKELEDIRKKYFGVQPNKQNSTLKLKEQESKSSIKVKKLNFIDFIDTLIGLILCLSLYTFNHNFVTLGVLSAFIGIFMGLLDVYYRERQLILTKMFVFLIAGMVLYIYGYYII